VGEKKNKDPGNKIKKKKKREKVGEEKCRMAHSRGS